MPFPVEERYICDAEAKLGLRLPDAYRLKLMRQNGGQLSAPPDTWELYPVRDASDRNRLKRTWNDLVLETRNARAWPGFPSDAIPIGTNGSGDLLVFLRSPDVPGVLTPTLYWWDHETGAVHEIVQNVDDVL